MKNLFIFYFLLFLFSFSFISIAFAQTNEQPKLSFGSIQYQKSASATPGTNFSFDIYFFIDQEYGTRTAHLILELESPEGWNVSVFPPIKQTTWNISGILVNSSENLYIEPRPLLQSIPEPKEDGIYYIASPSGKGYLQAKKSTIYVNIPENAEIGKSYQINVSALANYFGEQGSIMFSQSRSFSFTVQIVAPKYTEQLVTKNESRNETESNASKENISSISQNINVSQNTSESGKSAENIEIQQSQSQDIGMFIVVAAVIIAAAIILTRKPQPSKPYKDYEKELKTKNNNKTKK